MSGATSYVGWSEKPGPRLHDRALTELEVGLALAAGDVEVDLLALALQLLDEALGLLEHAGGVGAGEAAVAGHDQDRGPLGVLGLGGQRVVDVGERRHGRHRTGQLTGVRRGRLGPLLRLDDAGRGDELHGTRDLLHRLRRLDPRAVLAYRESHGSAPLLLDDLLLLDVLVLESDVLLLAGLDRLAVGGLELVEEGVVRRAELRLGGVLELRRLADAGEDAVVRAAQVVEELVLEPS